MAAVYMGKHMLCNPAACCSRAVGSTWGTEGSVSAAAPASTLYKRELRLGGSPPAPGGSAPSASDLSTRLRLSGSALVATGTEDKSSTLESGPEKLLLLLRKAAGAQRSQWA